MSPRILLGAAIALAASSAGAQSPFFVAVAGGASMPLGTFGDAASTGWHAQASLGVSTLMQPIGLRLDGAYNNFTAKTIGPDQAVISATLNATYRLPMTNSPISPYLIAGLGGYNFRCTGSVDCGSTTKFGWNAGLGTKIAALRAKWFLEARFHSVEAEPGDVRFVPVTFGLIL